MDRELKSSHCVRVTVLPACSTWSSWPKFSYKESPMAWIGMLGEPACFRNVLCPAVSEFRPYGHENRQDDSPEDSSRHVTATADGAMRLSVRVSLRPSQKDL